MRYQRISADCHIDLPWIPPDLFTANASAALKDRMPYVTDGPDGRYWTAKNGTSYVTITTRDAALRAVGRGVAGGLQVRAGQAPSRRRHGVHRFVR